MDETDTTNSDGYMTPLRAMVTETYEVYEELLAVGFPVEMITQIISNMLLSALDDRMTAIITLDYEDDDDEEGFDDEQGFTS